MTTQTTAPSVKYVIVERQQFSGRYVALRNLAFSSEAQAKAHIEQKYKSAYRERLHVESRIVKPDDADQRMTCQCCNRPILAKVGNIAHHGYTRPGDGWQTSSCFGAKELPWEVSRDAVMHLINHLKARLRQAVEGRDEVAAERGEVAIHYRGEYDRKTGRDVQMTEFVTRDTFDAVVAESPHILARYYGDKSFDTFKAMDLKARDANIKRLRDDIAEFTARYNGWKQTHKREGDVWLPL